MSWSNCTHDRPVIEAYLVTVMFLALQSCSPVQEISPTPDGVSELAQVKSPATLIQVLMKADTVEATIWDLERPDPSRLIIYLPSISGGSPYRVFKLKAILSILGEHGLEEVVARYCDISNEKQQENFRHFFVYLRERSVPHLIQRLNSKTAAPEVRRILEALDCFIPRYAPLQFSDDIPNAAIEDYRILWGLYKDSAEPIWKRNLRMVFRSLKMGEGKAKDRCKEQLLYLIQRHDFWDDTDPSTKERGVDQINWDDWLKANEDYLYFDRSNGELTLDASAKQLKTKVKPYRN